MSKWGQTWHYRAKKALENKTTIRPKALANELGIHYQKATWLLQSLGWVRKRTIYNSDLVEYEKETEQ